MSHCAFYVSDKYEHDLIMVTKKDSNIRTIIKPCATDHVAEEVERALEDAVGVARLMSRNTNLTFGGGSTQAYLYNQLKEHCRPEGRVQMAVDAFAETLLTIPKAIAENAGLDPVDEMLALVKNSKDGNIRYFVDVEPEKSFPHDALIQGVIEPVELHKQALTSATEAAIMVLRIDDVIRMNPSQPGPPQM